MRISDWSSDVCSSDLRRTHIGAGPAGGAVRHSRKDIMASRADQLASNLSFSKFGQATELKNRIWFTIGALIVFRFLSFVPRSEEHTSELQSLMRISYAVFCLKKQNKTTTTNNNISHKSLRVMQKSYIY